MARGVSEIDRRTFCEVAAGLALNAWVGLAPERARPAWVTRGHDGVWRFTTDARKASGSLVSRAGRLALYATPTDGDTRITLTGPLAEVHLP